MSSLKAHVRSQYEKTIRAARDRRLKGISASVNSPFIHLCPLQRGLQHRLAEASSRNFRVSNNFQTDGINIMLRYLVCRGHFGLHLRRVTMMKKFAVMFAFLTAFAVTVPAFAGTAHAGEKVPCTAEYYGHLPC
jgi:hypothetical protein